MALQVLVPFTSRERLLKSIIVQQILFLARKQHLLPACSIEASPGKSIGTASYKLA
jgi:hypothetical protein